MNVGVVKPLTYTLCACHGRPSGNRQLDINSTVRPRTIITVRPHVLTNTRPSRFLACSIKKLGVAWGRGYTRYRSVTWWAGHNSGHTINTKINNIIDRNKTTSPPMNITCMNITCRYAWSMHNNYCQIII